jgi:hypothetical protein
MNTCRTCLHLAVGRRFVRCGSLRAPREALPHLVACARWERADDALNEPREAGVVVGPWTYPSQDATDIPVAPQNGAQ